MSSSQESELSELTRQHLAADASSLFTSWGMKWRSVNRRTADKIEEQEIGGREGKEIRWSARWRIEFPLIQNLFPLTFPRAAAYAGTKQTVNTET